MPKKEKLPHRIDETVAEIAAILARGFLEYKRNRQPAEDLANLERDVSQFEESKELVEKRLACSPYQSVHALKS
ncbi:hypothetical protein [Desulfatitalea tepidiphila]|uniref:hypothetical protein n=1 Tax=Desulfatitalea tepidiphila TaxID=1185843 RepID=UPI0006B51B92|nr:hypothetical protein [Desulfatitalea tepidiphila]